MREVWPVQCKLPAGVCRVVHAMRMMGWVRGDGSESARFPPEHLGCDGFEWLSPMASLHRSFIGELMVEAGAAAHALWLRFMLRVVVGSGLSSTVTSRLQVMP